MDKHAVALVLSEIGTLLDLQGENKFKARAFLMAARAVEKLEEGLPELARAGRIESVRGIGPATAAVIHELLQTGGSRYYDQLRERTPSGMRELLAVPGLGARRAHRLHAELGISSLADLERAAAEGRIAELPGFGARTQERLALAAGFVRGATGRRRITQALEPAERVLGYVRGLTHVRHVELAGELRRWLETVSGVELVIAAPANRCDAVLDAFLAMPGLRADARKGDVATGRLADGLVIRARCVPPAAFAAALVTATGSDAHLHELAAHARSTGVRVDESGIAAEGAQKAGARSEEAYYRALGLPWIAPELREGRGEVAAAAAGELPALVAFEDLHGCFHCHTTYSDGRSTIAELAAAAVTIGWRYLGIADHSQAAGYAGGLTIADIDRQHAEIDDWNELRGDELRLFKGIEADILSDGRLDYAEHGDRVLGRFDYVIGSVHSAFGMGEADMTRRVLRAVENPHLTILGHPTGRLLLTRDGYAIDIEAVLEAAARRGVAVEINADPFRLDLDWRYWADARGSGVGTAINPDAHSARALENVRLGVRMARKGWLTAADVLNAGDLDSVVARLERKH